MLYAIALLASVVLVLAKAFFVASEDLLEEFVGEIRDEQDTDETPPIVHQPEGSFDVDGRLTLDVAARDRTSRFCLTVLEMRDGRVAQVAQVARCLLWPG